VQSQKKQKKKYIVKKKQAKSSIKQPKHSTNKSNNSVYNEITEILILSLGLLIFLSYYIDDSMGIFGSLVKKILTGMAGIPSFLIPLMLIVFPILMIFKKDKATMRKKGIYAFILLSLVCAIFHSGTYKYFDYVNRSPVDCIVKFYNDGKGFIGGGVIGGVISLPLLLLFQTLGTIVILTTAAIIMLILITDISLHEITRNVISSILTGSRNLVRGIREGREMDVIEDSNLYEFGSHMNSANTNEIYTEGKDEGSGFTLNIKGGEEVYVTGDSNDEQQTKVVDIKQHRKAKFLTLNNEKALEVEVKQQQCGSEFKTEVQMIDKESEKSIPENDKKVAGKNVREMFYKYPPISILNSNQENGKNLKNYKNTAIEGAKKLEETLKSFGVEAKVVNVSIGPVITRYEIQPSSGVKVSRIVSLADDIALNLASSGVRIEAPIPGKAAIGIEVPNKEVTPVLLREVIESQEFNKHPSKVAFSVGKDISGECVVADIAKMPHMLIAGATGSGKSVCINSLIMSILYKSSPDEVKMLLIDPKVVELGVYNGIPHLLIPVVTDPKKAAGALNWAVQEMINRYKLFADKGVRDIKGYNELVSNSDEQDRLPLIVIIIDELSDLMMAAPGDVEDAICRLAQMARAAGMHIVIATQRPSVDVITGLIKANIPSRISFAVSSQVDSRTILDIGGAEKLLGKGDMLFYPAGRQKPLRVQGAFVSDKEVENTVEFIKSQCNHEYDNAIIDEIDNSSAKEENLDSEYDELLPQAIEMVVEAGQASVSLVQRRFKVGYARAARIIDQMEARGIVGGFEGSKPRQILITKQQWQEMKMSVEQG